MVIRAAMPLRSQLFIYPPLAKASEPPAGIARLSGALSAHGVRHSLIDANLDGQLFLLDAAESGTGTPSDTWTKRAIRNAVRNVAALRDIATYRNLGRYKRAVEDVSRVLRHAGTVTDSSLSLSDFHHAELSPVRSGDLLRAAEHPEGNPFYAYFAQHIPLVIERDRPELIGISLCYLSQALSAFALMGFLRRCYPDIRIACGGGLMTSWMRRPGWSNPFAGLVDFCIDGPGETAILDLAGVPPDNNSPSLPNYDAFPLSRYFSPGLVLPYSASSGCFWNRCTFCPENAEDNIYVPLRAQQTAEELSLHATHLRPSLLHLLDNAVSPAHMKAIIANPPGVPWYGFARVDKELTDPDFCRALKQSGCVMLKLGVESGDQAVLDAMQKGVQVATAAKVLRTLKQAGIGAYVYLLFGTPAETIEAARRTLEFTARHAENINFLNLAIFNMPIGIPDADRFETGSFYDGDLSLYTDFRHPEGWNRREVRLFLDREFRRNPAIAEILKNDPPYFTSNHAPFLLRNRS